MELLPGVIKEERDGYALYVVERFSDELKQEIRRYLTKICRGASQAASAKIMYSYRETAKEFTRLYKTSTIVSQNRQKGLVGELLAHLLLEIEGHFIAATPFYNSEERSFKKGFDIMLIDPKTQELWIAEIKSGSKPQQKQATSAIVSLLNKAQTDLRSRLGERKSANVSLWHNAVQAARNAMSDSNSLKATVISLLEDCGDNVVLERNSSQTFNVVLIGALFHPTTSERIDATIVGKKHAKIVEAQYFKNALVVAIQKGNFRGRLRFFK